MRNNDSAVQARIDPAVLVEVLKGITSGLTYSQLVKYLTAKEITVPPEQLPAYFAEAHRHYTNLANYARDVETGKAIERLQSLYSASLQIQDFKACLAIQKELNTLMRLKDHTPGNDNLPPITVTIPKGKKRK